MATQSASIFTQNSRDRLSGFLVVISPSKEVEGYTNDMKKEFYEQYGPYHGRYSKPHITVCNFPLLEERQDKVFSTLQQGFSEIDPFLLKLNGFGSFENSNVIYLNVEDSSKLRSLKQAFYHMSRKLWLVKNFNLVDTSHLTIARKLPPDIFELAKSAYLSRCYRNYFTVDSLKVLRYDMEKERYFDFGELKLGG
ncbi:2'-5' RNA ligase family protein [Aliifodinibius sp. S!AR15-10]|uniref:2'-5' RNA ligase family protein n=1 Tax=Aliifodinibius sp. S!AR15-10 TaxID=2950437 RepID=UPI00285EE08A|nr:2'-5' RNA ligase family protein [Aliifodinibius sp. S!AR15-10]MDR8389546.1 2'-5' RNA ligase family protein [Aliifodinibius sp. S!AR15-10]